MGHVDERDADILLDLLQLDLHLLAKLQVERPQRLVQQQDLRLVHDRAGEGHALALAAGELVRAAMAQAFEPDHLQRSQHAPFSGRFRDSLYAQPVADVVGHRHVRKERVVLEHGVGVAQVGRQR